ncbi:MAG: lipocalin family protein [Acidobacteriota bacterium]
MLRVVRRRRCGGRALALGAAFAAALPLACASSPSGVEPLPTVDFVDMDRFMGDWFVLAIIPNAIEKDAYASVESYARRPDGRVDITFTFRKGGFDGKEKTLDMVGTVFDTSTNAEWRVRPFWPLNLRYLVTDLADDYRYTVIGHPSRDFLWIMARDRELPEDDWKGILARLESQGYDLGRIQRIPQIPPTKGA